MTSLAQSIGGIICRYLQNKWPISYLGVACPVENPIKRPIVPLHDIGKHLPKIVIVWHLIEVQLPSILEILCKFLCMQNYTYAYATRIYQPDICLDHLIVKNSLTMVKCILTAMQTVAKISNFGKSQILSVCICIMAIKSQQGQTLLIYTVSQ